MEELLKFIDEKIKHGVEIINSNYKNDSDKSCQDWAKGSVNAYKEVQYFVEEKLKKQDYNETRDEKARPKQEQPQA